MTRESLMIRKKMFTTILIILILTSLTFSGCISENDENNTYVKFNFELEVNSDNTTTLLWPIPIDRSPDNVSNLVDELEINKGDAEYFIDQTEYGPALNITFKDQVNIVAYKKFEDEENKNTNANKYWFTDLSMETNVENEYRVYSSNNIEITNFVTSVETVDDTPRYFSANENILLSRGWEIIEL